MERMPPHLSDMPDESLDRILSAASVISVPQNAEQRLMHRIAQDRPAKPASRRFAIRAALPLAASLLLGIYLGAGGYGDTYLAGATTSQDDDSYFSTGFEDTLTAAEDNPA